MPTIRISDGTFRALQEMAEPLVDTPGSVIDRLVREHRERTGATVEPEQDPRTAPARAFDPASPPGLTHTMIDKASVDGKPLERLRWANVLLHVIKAVGARGYSGQALVDSLNINARTDVFEERGYKHYPELGLSIQGQAAQDAWRETARLALQHSIPLEIAFHWRDKPAADYPGGKGTMTVT